MIKNWGILFFTFTLINTRLLDNVQFSQLNINQAQLLFAPFTDTEIKTTSQLGQWKAPSLDGLPVGFFSENWDIVRIDVIGLVKNMATSSMFISNLNYTDIVLFQKGKTKHSLLTFDLLFACATPFIKYSLKF